MAEVLGGSAETPVQRGRCEGELNWWLATVRRGDELSLGDEDDGNMQSHNLKNLRKESRSLRGQVTGS